MNHQHTSALHRRIRELEGKEAKWAEAEDNSVRLAAMVQSADDAIIGKTITGIVQSWNPGAERLYGYSAEEMVDHEMTILLPPDRSDEEAFILARIARGERVDHFDTVRLRKDGRLINVSIAISPIMGRNGSIIGASHVALPALRVGFELFVICAKWPLFEESTFSWRMRCLRPSRISGSFR